MIRDSAVEEEFMDELRAARASGRRLPDFFLVGHAKCGTTALYEMLTAHPQIYMPVLKETQFLSRLPQERAAQPTRREDVRPRTLEAYLSLFEGAQPGQRVGEASTEYLRAPATAGRIAELCPDASIVAIFREPASFLRSLHLQLLQVNIETESDFSRAIALEDDRRHGRNVPRGCPWPPALYYSQHVRYVEQLRSYHEHFGRERVLALAYDDFRADNEGTVRRVMGFVDVDDTVQIAPSEANPTVRIRSHRLGDLVGDVAVGRSGVARVVGGAVKSVTSERMRARALQTVKRVNLEADPHPANEEFMGELRARFKGEVVALSEYLQRDLVSLWGYNDVPEATVTRARRGAG
jgi:Sulfotransferase family